MSGNLKQLIISPPFGNYLRFDCASSVFGTYTLEPRKGLLKQIIKTVRPIKGGGWRNNIGFRNPGIMNAKNPKDKRHIISITAFELDHWYMLADSLSGLEDAGYEFGTVEINISCPNKVSEPITADAFRKLEKWNPIIKLAPHEQTIKDIGNYLDWGAKHFHLSNTLPSEKGGISGPQLQVHSLKLIEEVRKIYGNTPKIIGGGGIYSIDDVKRYESVGVDRYSISTACFNPIKLFKLVNYFKPLNPLQTTNISEESE